MNFDRWVKPTIHDVTVGKQPIIVNQAVSRYLLELEERHMDHVAKFAILEEYPEILGGLVYSLRSFLLKSTQNETQTFSIQVPATWWDHLKQDLCNSHRFWMQRIGFLFAPPKYRTESKAFEVSIRLCPHNDSYLSDKPLEHFHWLTWEDDDVKKT